MRIPIVLFATLAALAGCTTQRDYDTLLSAALQVIERGSRVETIVLSPSLPTPARRSAESLRKVVSHSSVVPSKGYDLPAGYFVLRSITISGDIAHVVGTTGPIPSKATLACGTTYDISFARTGGQWRPGEIELTVC